MATATTKRKPAPKAAPPADKPAPRKPAAKGAAPTKKKPAADATAAITDDGVLELIPIDAIETHPAQPRTEFDEKKLQRLADSLGDDSLLQRPIVRQIGSDRYQLIVGERRLRAAKLAGWTELPVTLRTLSDLEALRLLGVENLQRADWNPVETARYLASLCESTAKGGAGLTETAVAELYGRSQAWVANLVGLLNLPTAWQRRVITREMSASQARLLVPHAKNAELLRTIAADFAAQPWAWDNYAKFERNLKLVIENDAAVVTRPAPRPPRATPAQAATKPQAGQDRDDEPAAPASRASAAAAHVGDDDGQDGELGDGSAAPLLARLPRRALEEFFAPIQADREALETVCEFAAALLEQLD